MSLLIAFLPSFWNILCLQPSYRFLVLQSRLLCWLLPFLHVHPLVTLGPEQWPALVSLSSSWAPEGRAVAVARCEEASQITLGSRSLRRKRQCRLDVPGGPVPDEGRQQSASRGAMWGRILKALLVTVTRALPPGHLSRLETTWGRFERGWAADLQEMGSLSLGPRVRM